MDVKEVKNVEESKEGSGRGRGRRRGIYNSVTQGSNYRAADSKVRIFIR